MVRLSSVSAQHRPPPPPPPFTDASICTPYLKKKQKKTSNGRVLKNDSQYPLAIEVRNFLLLNEGGKIDMESGRQGGRTGGRRASVAFYIDIYCCEAVWEL